MRVNEETNKKRKRTSIRCGITENDAGTWEEQRLENAKIEQLYILVNINKPAVQSAMELKFVINYIKITVPLSYICNQ